MMNQEDSPDTTAEADQKPEMVLSEETQTKLEHQVAYVKRIMRRLGVVHESNTPKQSEGILFHCRQQMDELEEYVSLLKGGLNRWCLSVMVWEFMMLIILAAALVGGSFLAGYWSLESPWQPWQQQVMARPILIVMSLAVFIIFWIAIHASLRQWQAKLVVNYLQRQVGDDRLSRAFLKNTTFWHSIFRPEPVGWSWWGRRRMSKIRQMLDQIEGREVSSEKPLQADN